MVNYFTLPLCFNIFTIERWYSYQFFEVAFSIILGFDWVGQFGCIDKFDSLNGLDSVDC